ncbi:hypothetical protein CRG98_019639 [Punica granatum]|uniref:Uncharacterized protein n=1 Tax=Punica granatum TaxID=22663 RepID=A0A2I0JUN9_PUNGR|nr:hypothetical protein CRG98_019639 [Punica granatum]
MDPREFEISNLCKALCDTARLAFGYELRHARRLMMISYRSSFSEHRWFGRCGASRDDFQVFENTACHMRQTRIRRRGASPGVPDRICTGEREAYKGCNGGILWDPPNQGYVDSTPFQGESRAWRVEESLLASENAEPLLGAASRRSVAILSWSS